MLVTMLDRRMPTDWRHVEKYPVRRRLPAVAAATETLLDVPRQYRDEYDQGTEGACVGYSQSWLMSILNRKLYDPYRLYATAQGIDEFDDTPPAAGTSLRAGFDVLRTLGHWRVWAGQTRAPMLVEGIDSNWWASSVDEVRTSVSVGVPVNLGLNWYQQFSSPESRARYGDKVTSRRREYWIGVGAWGSVDGGHAITVVGASDARQAVALCNTWGPSYPFLVWLPYDALTRLLSEDGEAGVVLDRVKQASTLAPPIGEGE